MNTVGPRGSGDGHRPAGSSSESFDRDNHYRSQLPVKRSYGTGTRSYQVKQVAVAAALRETGTREKTEGGGGGGGGPGAIKG